MDIRIVIFKTLLVITFFAYPINCFSQKKISKIKFVFAEEGIVNVIATSCTVESFNEFDVLNYNIIRDKRYIKKFSRHFKKLVPDSNVFVIDARIMTIISYVDSERKDTLCFGEFHGIDLNGTFMRDNSKLLKLVKKKVWAKFKSD